MFWLRVLAGPAHLIVFDPRSMHSETVAIPTRGSVLRNMTTDSARGRLWLALSGVGQLGRVDLGTEPAAR